MEKIHITEADHLEKEWFQEARKQTVETLPAFINHVMNDYEHDYGTVCHAVAACAMAGFAAANNLPSGGITGYQAGFVMWDIIRDMNYPHNECGLRLQDFDNMLYPQYADKFARTIPDWAWTAMQKKAKQLLKTRPDAHYAVKAHWGSIAAGNIPFGFTVENEG